MVTFPGIAVVLAPIAVLSDTLHLSSLTIGGTGCPIRPPGSSSYRR